jgi:hypothetical protein
VAMLGRNVVEYPGTDTYRRILDIQGND